MNLTQYGEYEPDLNFKELRKDDIEKAEFACPFLNENYNEDRLGKEFCTDSPNYNDKLGYYRKIYGGHVVEGEYRNSGTSGGFGTWIGVELLKYGLIDGVIHVKETARHAPTDPFSAYNISMTPDEIASSSRTKYHVVQYSDVLRSIKNLPGKKFLFIGLPCMIKSIRRIQLIDLEIRKKIPFTAALVCGHLKSMNWSLSLAWGAGIHPSETTAMKYRTKGEGIPARAYVFTAYKKNQEIVQDSARITGGKFNQGALMLNACNFCDDVVGETADLTIGDAWLPQFEMDSKGNNLLIIRNEIISNLIEKARTQNKIRLIDLNHNDAIDSQAGGFRQRREGLSYRLGRYVKNGKWHPVKRVKPDEFKVPFLRKIVYDMRWNVALKSKNYFLEALKNNRYEFYKKRMNAYLLRLRCIEILTSLPRIIRKKIAVIYLKTKSKINKF